MGWLSSILTIRMGRAFGEYRLNQAGRNIMPTDSYGLAVSTASAAARDAYVEGCDLLLTVYPGTAALAAIRAHLDIWPRDALVLSLAANQGGLIGMSGPFGRKQELATFLDGLATHHGDDWWFNAHSGMALSEACQQEAARPRIERSVAEYPRNAYAVYAFAHFCYETGERDVAITCIRERSSEHPARAAPRCGPHGVMECSGRTHG